MMNYLLRISLFLVLFTASMFAQAQTTDTWQNVHAENGVTIDYQIVECNGMSWLVLRAQNTNSWPMNINYDVSTTDGAGNDLLIAQGQQLTIEGGQRLTGSCEDKNLHQLLLPLFSPFENPQSVKLRVLAL